MRIREPSSKKTSPFFLFSRESRARSALPRSVGYSSDELSQIYIYIYNNTNLMKGTVPQDSHGTTLFSKKGRITPAPPVKIDMNYNGAAWN